MNRGRRWFAVLGLSVIAAVLYGICHDLVTAHLCVEYFTIGHPPVFKTTEPVLLALGWGTIATWWMGCLIGIPLASLATAGQRPLFPTRLLIRWISWMLIAMAIGSVIAGIVGFVLASTASIHLSGRLAELVPADLHAAFLTNLFAHGAAYGIAMAGGITICSLVWKRRGQMLQLPGNDSCP